MSAPFLVDFGKIGSLELGYITIAEHPKVTFEIRRVYWTYYSPNDVVRGHHAHIQLQQILVAVSGQVKVHLENLHGKAYVFTLDNPAQGVYVPPLHWRTIQMSHNAVLLCLASSVYDESDYIRDYELFKKWK